MSNDPDAKNWLESAKKNWGLLALGAVWLVGIIGSFVLTPPADVATDDNKIYLGLVKFVVAVLIGLVIVVAHKTSKKHHAKYWALATLILLMLAVLSFDAYQKRFRAWTCVYDNERKVVGDVLTPQGAEYRDANPGGISCEDLLLDFAGKVEDVWTKESLDGRRLSLARIYLLCVSLFTLCLLSVVQCLYCITSGPKGDAPGAQALSPPPHPTE